MFCRMTGEFLSKPKSRLEKTHPNNVFGKPNLIGVYDKGNKNVTENKTVKIINEFILFNIKKRKSGPL